VILKVQGTDKRRKEIDLASVTVEQRKEKRRAAGVGSLCSDHGRTHSKYWEFSVSLLGKIAKLVRRIYKKTLHS